MPVSTKKTTDHKEEHLLLNLTAIRPGNTLFAQRKAQKKKDHPPETFKTSRGVIFIASPTEKKCDLTFGRSRPYAPERRVSACCTELFAAIVRTIQYCLLSASRRLVTLGIRLLSPPHRHVVLKLVLPPVPPQTTGCRAKLSTLKSSGLGS